MVIENKADDFKEEFDKTIDSLEGMTPNDKSIWKKFNYVIKEMFLSLYFANKNDVRGNQKNIDELRINLDKKIDNVKSCLEKDISKVQKNLDDMKRSCELVHNKDDEFLLVEEFDEKADNYINNKLKFISWLIVALAIVICGFGVYIWKTTIDSIDRTQTNIMKNIDKTQADVSSVNKDVNELKDVFIEYLKQETHK